jgi:hypothetical protein
MIDFKNGALIKLKPLKANDLYDEVAVFLIDGEVLIASFQAMRDKVVFTNKRIISINVQGLTGKKVDYTSLPYSKVQAFSVETSGVFDMDCEIELMFSGVAGLVRFEIRGSFDIKGFNRVLSEHIL